MMISNNLRTPILIIAGLLALACGSPPEVTFVADEARTTEIADRNKLGYCHILSREVCQSPDSLLVFHLPIELKMNAEDRVISEELLISNNGFAEVVIEEYFLTLMDDRNRSYRPGFSGPNDYTEQQPFSPALVLGPGQQVKIRFTERLETDYPALQRVSIFYRLEGETEMSQVVWSFKARNIEAI
jgi:hypothetical protein